MSSLHRKSHIHSINDNVEALREAVDNLNTSSTDLTNIQSGISAIEMGVNSINDAINNEAVSTRNVEVVNSQPLSVSGTYDYANSVHIEEIKNQLYNGTVSVALLSNDVNVSNTVEVSNSDLQTLNLKIPVSLQVRRQAGECFVANHYISGNNTGTELVLWNSVNNTKSIFIYQLMYSVVMASSSSIPTITLFKCLVRPTTGQVFNKINNLNFSSVNTSSCELYAGLTVPANEKVELETIYTTHGNPQILDYQEEMMEIPANSGYIVRMYGGQSWNGFVSFRFYEALL